MRSILGIDPGQNGAIVTITTNKIAAEPIPHRKDKFVDVAEFQALLIFNNPAFVVLERQQYRSRQAGQALIARNYERIRVTLELCGIPFVEVSPQKWQAHFGITGGKAEHIAKAISLGYNVPYTSYRSDGTPRANAVRWHDAADAFLLARYGAEQQEVMRMA